MKPGEFGEVDARGITARASVIEMRMVRKSIGRVHTARNHRAGNEADENKRGSDHEEGQDLDGHDIHPVVLSQTGALRSSLLNRPFSGGSTLVHHGLPGRGCVDIERPTSHSVP